MCDLEIRTRIFMTTFPDIVTSHLWGGARTASDREFTGVTWSLLCRHNSIGLAPCRSDFVLYNDKTDLLQYSPNVLSIEPPPPFALQ